MKISARVNYACQALIELGLHWPNKSPLQIHEIGNRQGIPTNFLTHILISLKQAGYVDSIRGKNGGYILSRTPSEITLKDVMLNFGGAGILASVSPLSEKTRIMDAIWKEIDREILAKMETLTLARICDRVRSHNATIVFNI